MVGGYPLADTLLLHRQTGRRALEALIVWVGVQDPPSLQAPRQACSEPRHLVAHSLWDSTRHLQNTISPLPMVADDCSGHYRQLRHTERREGVRLDKRGIVRLHTERPLSDLLAPGLHPDSADPGRNRIFTATGPAHRSRHPARQQRPRPQHPELHKDPRHGSRGWDLLGVPR